MSLHQASLSAVPAASAISQMDIQTQYGEASYTETRKVSSVVVESTVIGELPQQDTIRYVEVPTVEEQIKYVTKHEIREVEKRVPKYEYEWVEKIVEKPVIVEKRREVEVPQYVDKIIEKKVKQIVERPVEVLKEVRVPKTITKEKIIEVPGEIIEVPKPYTVEVPVEVAHPVDKKVAVIVSQTVKPVIVEGSETMIVDVLDYEPEVIPVDVHIAKPVVSALKFVGQTDAKHRVVNVTAAQYNTILRQLNVHMDEKLQGQLPYVSESNTIPFAGDVHYIVAPENVWHDDAKVSHTKHHQTIEARPRDVSGEEFSHVTVEQQKKSRMCCNNTGSKAKDARTIEPVPVTSVQGSHISHHSVRSGTHSRLAGEASLTHTQPHTVQTIQTQSAFMPVKEGVSSTTSSYTTGHGSSVTTQKRHEPSSQISFGPQGQPKQRVCC